MNKRTVGIDEVGRGCWAGPLVVAAVLLQRPIPELKDSKLLSKSQRLRFFSRIQLESVSISVGWCTAQQVDELGLTRALRLLMHQVMEQMPAFTEVVVDGKINYLDDIDRSRSLIKADQTVPAVSAASIVAKVLRDRYMSRLDTLYPEFQFSRHVGYGTAGHLAALKNYGPTPYHRLSFRPLRTLI